MLKVIFILILLGYIIEKLSLHKNLSQFTYNIQPQVQSVEPEEYFTVISTVRNISKKSIRKLSVEHILPCKIKIKDIDEVPNYHSINYMFETCLQLKKQHEVTIEFDANISTRGIHKFEGCNLYSGDFAGFSTKTANIKAEASVIVYPIKIENARLNQMLSNTIGKTVVQRSIYQDPILVKGYREYTGHEPFKDISWNQTAMRGSLVVKEYDYTKEQHVTIVLDSSYKNDYEMTHKHLEYCFSIIRTICEKLVSNQINFNFVSNSKLTNEDNGFLNCSYSINDASQLKYFLIMLGKCSYNYNYTCSQLSDYVINNVHRLSLFNNLIIYVSTCRANETTDSIKRISARANVDVMPIYAEDYITEEKVANNSDRKVI